ncbi:MAG: enoyl-CoA hydratase/isomerase family protein [Rubrivivax sp.]|nr:enoyl-CoA hydratase/isomerase family protein [Rubrivivax sp.]
MTDVPEQCIATSLAADGVLVATVDMPGRTMNVFSAGLMDALDALMDRAERDDAVKSVVITSGKPSFLAGADLVMVRGYTEHARTATHDEMFTTCGRLGRQFVRLEASRKPWVAAVNGVALGGGLELALACRQRFVADDARIQLGVPEVRWGLLPGAGGTQRLPRLAPFEAAMELLLTGRSMAPAEAVALGVFGAAVPAANLLERACEAARSMHGAPYDAAAKFGRLAQADVPAPGEANARAVGARHGVDGERYALYPAYGAICDSVLQGAHLPLAEATAVEMNNFLRLMFSPVAGRMIRSLFLERLRAERELAPPAGVALKAIERGPISAARVAWSAALAKLKVEQTESPELPADTLELVDLQGARCRVVLRVLDDDPATHPQPQLVLAPVGPYGRVVEVVGADDAAAAAAAALVTRLWALPWRSPGPLSVLQRLRALPLEQQAMLATAHATAAGAGDPAFLDVAACLAGVSPAWSGGPLSWAASTNPKP